MKPARFTFIATLIGAASTTAALAADPQPSPAQEAFKLRMDGKSDEAEALLERALAANEDDAPAWFELARTRIYHFNLDGAADAVDRAIELAPDNARYHYLAGLNHGYNAVSKAHEPETRKQVDPLIGKSLAAFQDAVELDPDDHDARMMLINMLLEAPRKQGGSRAKAKEHVELIESKDEVRGLEARCMLMDGSAKKAVKLWKPMVAAHPERADAHAGLAMALIDATEFDKADAHIDRAIELDPSHRDLLLLLCRECVSANDRKRAEQAVQRYIASEPPLPAPLRSFGTFYLAVLHKQQGDSKRGDELMAEAREIDPHVWTTYMEPAAVLFDAP